MNAVEDFVAQLSPRVGGLIRAARAKIVKVVPGAVERLRPGWGLIGYNAPAYFAFIVPAEDHVKIGFERGVELWDPEALLEGTGKQVRYVVIGSRRALQSAALTALLRQAAALGSRESARRRSG